MYSRYKTLDESICESKIYFERQSKLLNRIEDIIPEDLNVSYHFEIPPKKIRQIKIYLQMPYFVSEKDNQKFFEWHEGIISMVNKIFVIDNIPSIRRYGIFERLTDKHGEYSTEIHLVKIPLKL